MVSRRALLLAGGATILAGCGKEKAAAEPPPVTEVLLRSVAAERALSVAARLQESSDRALLQRIARRAADRAGRAAAALSAAGGRPHDAPEPAAADDPLERGRAALEAHVAALPSLSGRDQRDLGAFLVEESAADLAVLEDVLASASGNAFPGTPT